MLESLTIWNFQRHQYKHIDFAEHTTTLTGPTDAGKSTIIRALKWLFFNQPQGIRFVRWDAEFVKVKAVIDGHKIIRKRGKKGNLYLLDGKRYVSFNNTVPDDIRKVLQVSAENLQRQLDYPFWFSLSPSQVAKELNKIVNLELIDQTQTNLASEQRKAKMTVDIAYERLTEAEQKKKELNWVPKLNEQLKRLEKRFVIITTAKEQMQRLELLLNAVTEQQQRLADIPVMDLSNLEAQADDILILSNRSQVLGRLLEELLDLQTKRDAIDKRRKQTETELHQLTKGRCPICGKEMNDGQTTEESAD